eukprot:2850859-Prymnesium_polylepis.1
MRSQTRIFSFSSKNSWQTGGHRRRGVQPSAQQSPQGSQKEGGEGVRLRMPFARGEQTRGRRRTFVSGSGAFSWLCCVLYVSITTSLSFLGVSSTLEARKRHVVATVKRS